MAEHTETGGRLPRLVAPHPTAGLCTLERVGDRLTDATGAVAVVAAPAGYGKTSQVAAWAEADGRAVVWIDVEVTDNDAGPLVDAVIDGLTAAGAVVPSEVASWRTSHRRAATTLLPVLGRAVQRCTTPFILVFDDLHLLESPRAIDLVEVLASNVAATSTLVLIGRDGTMAARTRLAAHLHVVEVTAAELTLDAADVARMLDVLGVALDDDAITLLVEDTEGWPVGVRLAASALPEEKEPVGFDWGAADYLREEWLRGMSADDVALLTKVAVLDRLTGPLCDHMVGRGDTASDLARLHSSRLVIPLDGGQESYRVHHLLRQVLLVDLERTDPGATRRSHAHAADWFEAHGDIDSALQHALRAGDLERGERLVLDRSIQLHATGDDATITRWIAAFPEGYVTSRPSLCLTAAVAQLGDPDGESVRVAAWLRYGEHALAAQPQPDAETELRFATFRALVGSAPAEVGLADARRGREGLPPGVWHAYACLAHGAWSFAVGDDVTAERALDEAAAEAARSGAASLAAKAAANRAVLLSAAGDWSEAAPLVRSTRASVREHQLEQHPTQILVVALAAFLDASEGNTAQARAEWLLARQGMARLEGISPSSNVQCRIAMARASLLLSDRAGARALLEEAERLVQMQPNATRWHDQVAEIDALIQAANEATPWSPSSLTTAERRVLHYLPTNLTLAEIAARLYVSRNTTKSQTVSIYRKLGATTRGEAVEVAEVLGLLEMPDDRATS